MCYLIYMKHMLHEADSDKFKAPKTLKNNKIEIERVTTVIYTCDLCKRFSDKSTWINNHLVMAREIRTKMRTLVWL